MSTNRGRRQFSLVFASFFGAAMIAAAFAYSNWRFSEYKFVDFSKLIFYSKRDIFTPTEDRYTVVIYSSKMINFEEIVKKISKKDKVLAIDMFQEKRGEDKERGIIFVTSGMNTIIKVIQRFNIYELPTVFRIKRFRDSIYKQDSLIEVIE